MLRVAKVSNTKVLTIRQGDSQLVDRYYQSVVLSGEDVAVCFSRADDIPSQLHVHNRQQTTMFIPAGVRELVLHNCNCVCEFENGPSKKKLARIVVSGNCFNLDLSMLGQPKMALHLRTATMSTNNYPRYLSELVLDENIAIDPAVLDYSPSLVKFSGALTAAADLSKINDVYLTRKFGLPAHKLSPVNLTLCCLDEAIHDLQVDLGRTKTISAWTAPVWLVWPVPSVKLDVATSREAVKMIYYVRHLEIKQVLPGIDVPICGNPCIETLTLGGTPPSWLKPLSKHLISIKYSGALGEDRTAAIYNLLFCRVVTVEKVSDSLFDSLSAARFRYRNASLLRI